MNQSTGCGSCRSAAERRTCPLCATTPAAGAAPVASARRTRQPDPTTVRPGSDHGHATSVRDAAPVPGIPLSRLLNAACYLISGIAIIVIGTQVDRGTAGTVAVGLAAIAYGVYIALTRGSYWVTSWVYVLTVIAVVGMFSALAG